MGWSSERHSSGPVVRLFFTHFFSMENESKETFHLFSNKFFCANTHKKWYYAINLSIDVNCDVHEFCFVACVCPDIDRSTMDAMIFFLYGRYFSCAMGCGREKNDNSMGLCGLKIQLKYAYQVRNMRTKMKKWRHYSLRLPSRVQCKRRSQKWLWGLRIALFMFARSKKSWLTDPEVRFHNAPLFFLFSFFFPQLGNGQSIGNIIYYNMCVMGLDLKWKRVQKGMSTSVWKMNFLSISDQIAY